MGKMEEKGFIPKEGESRILYERTSEVRKKVSVK